MQKRKLLTIVLILSLILSLAACGGSEAPQNSEEQPAVEEQSAAEEQSATVEQSAALGQPAAESSDTGKEPEATAQQMDVTEEFKYEYGDDIVLMETENIRITARRLVYQSTDKGMVLNCIVHVQNLTDREIKTRTEWITNSEHHNGGGSKTEAGGEGNFRLTALYDWNGMMGETKDCYQGTCQLRVLIEDKVVDTVQFDWYTSKTTPFVNVQVGVPLDN